MILFHDTFCLFTRANAHEEGGYRQIQAAFSCHLKEFSSFQSVVFPTVPANANIYFGHPYRFRGDIILVMPIAFEASERGRSGIYVSWGTRVDHHKLYFEKPFLIYPSSYCRGRTINLPCAGGHIGRDGRLVLTTHCNIRSRMDKEMKATLKPVESFEI